MVFQGKESWVVDSLTISYSDPYALHISFFWNLNNAKDDGSPLKKVVLTWFSQFSPMLFSSASQVGDQYRSNDDGEPSGTAGKPIHSAILSSGIDRVMVVVIR